MASFNKQPNGKWRTRILYTNNQGEKKWLTKSGFATKKSAQEYANQMEYEYNRGGDLDNKNISFVDYVVKWYQTFREPKIMEATKSKYMYTIKVTQSYFGTTPISDISTSMYQDFLNFFGKGDSTRANPPHAKATVEKINGHLVAAVQNAINDGIITKDFTLNTHIVYDKSHTREHKYLSYTDTQKLVTYIKTKLRSTNTDNVIYYMILTALMTGMRISEIEGLAWDNVDLKNDDLRVVQTWNVKYRGIGPTKNESSNRLIRTNKEFSALLARRKFEQNTEFTLAKQTNQFNLVFVNHRNKLPDYGAINRALDRTVKEAGIDQPINFHGLRHTHASILLYKGISIAYISKRLGHQNIDTTTKVYLHIIQELQSEEEVKTADALDALLS
ncbi:tyrosine-type recombinase/integrase [Lentilactobacillus sp. SPB1-3]|uniref:Tyrosine-type recombinase/integrase n=1 Tax=Lentilactobacillus terminaliae TaxID=3003483 RepID=A0ACD5DDI2_9LACO|nr:tyrosine-type recombinase/integrase [Lentilactobacillus sp. SPB1-3]MCZ0978154.1 tyrosine-type recombinase/integrase [Lentilactobacillus sp. SPB1-3]